jgi:hypothetical protein
MTVAALLSRGVFKKNTATERRGYMADKVSSIPSVWAFQINPRLRKSPMFPPLERSIMSMVNLSRQTSQASSTP